ncbi:MULTISPECIES: transcriptional regulator FtrA [Methylobacterium]|uniref:transcriptional regulator FtrA n=1 Tax=Methylobacterium TaxID=407 RepID=UPI0011C9271C|nr:MULTISPECIES: transcriptional regulator FtrA [Methylobacterium]TXM99535.1 transcriptional regulator FtrA [Methylobacterium sp. WL122]TXN83255.1 transcriptional regulator FtrA [Methylobacterium sp. WL8]
MVILLDGRHHVGLAKLGLQLAETTGIVKIVPNTTGPLAVALLYDGLCTFEFGIVAEVFGLPRPEMGEAWYRFASCAVEGGPLRAHGGFTLTPDHGIELIDCADIIVVPGWKGSDEAVPEDLCHRLREAHERGARLVSICSGAFVLAATGLLDGGTATTHWRYAKALRDAHPKVAVDRSSLYRSYGRVFTSAGSAAGLDLLIEIVRQDYGPEAANSVARRLVMPAHRTGGQAQFLERPVPVRRHNEVAPLIDRMRAELGAPWPLTRMAEACRMSLRTFMRRFNEATGAPPGEWLAAERIEEAKRLLAAGRLSVDEIAVFVGLGGADTLRHHFRKRIGISPGEFRTRFSRPESARGDVSVPSACEHPALCSQ